MKVISYMIEAHMFRRNDDKIEFLLLKRAKDEIYPGVWQMITGSVVKEERAYDTVVREMNEETGLFPEKLWVVPYVNSFYSRKRNHICMVPVFVAQLSKDSQVIISEEHSDYIWADKDTAIRLLAWQGQRKSVEIIYDYLTDDNCFLNFEEIDLRRYKSKTA